MPSYLDGGHPFPRRTHLSVLFATFQIEVFETIERWVGFARDEIDEWPTTQDLGMAPRTETLTRLLAQDQSPLNPWGRPRTPHKRKPALHIIDQSHPGGLDTSNEIYLILTRIVAMRTYRRQCRRFPREASFYSGRLVGPGAFDRRRGAAHSGSDLQRIRED